MKQICIEKLLIEQNTTSQTKKIHRKNRRKKKNFSSTHPPLLLLLLPAVHSSFISSSFPSRAALFQSLTHTHEKASIERTFGRTRSILKRELTKNFCEWNRERKERRERIEQLSIEFHFISCETLDRISRKRHKRSAS